MALMKLWKALVRAMAALLLMAAIVTPALAEIGCAEDSFSHIEESLGAGEHAERLTTDKQSKDQDGQGAPVGHCAFSHGHCAGIPSVSSDAAKLLQPAALYCSMPTAPLVPTSLGTPERPPNT
jgi:hypothetical protein